MNLHVRMRRGTAALFAATSLAVAMVGTPVSLAQMPTDPMQPQMQPMPGTMPQQAPAGGSSMKQMFAGTLSAVLQTTGVGVAGVLTQAIGGAIQSWFNRPPKAAANTMGTMDPTASGMGMGQPADMGQSTGMGVPATMGSAPSAMGAPAPAMGDPSSMGMGTGQPAGMGQAPAMAMPGTPAIYAGLAFEVHARTGNGDYAPVDPATHSFATGERFVVHYRPSLPGQVIVMNVNPLGQEKQIDAVNVAAGELARLGPYEFRDNSGDELLRLILVPCRTDALLTATRDIVKVDEMLPPAAASAAPAGIPGLSECRPAGTRSVRPQTRDIAKVESEGGTMFALDPVSAQEVASGQVAPREITIAFRHR